MTHSLLLVGVLRAMRTSRHNRAGREVTVGRSMNERKGRWATTYSRSGRIARPGAAGAKKNCEIGVGFSFAALSVFRLRRAEAASAVWIPHSLPDIRSLSNRKGRGRRSGGREREPRRAGEASPKPPPKPPPRSGLCPELLADFRIPKPPGCSQGAQRAVFCAVRVADFLAEGAGWGASPGRGGELGCQAQQVLKKFVRLASAFPSPPTRSLSNRKGRGRRRGGREREPRRAGEGRCLELNSCVLIDYGLWAAKSEGRQWVEHCIEQCIE